MFIRQTFRIYPNKNQETILKQWMGQARFVWNYMLQKNMERYEDEGKFIFVYDMNNLLPGLKNQQEYLWLKEIPAQCLQQKCQDLDRAIKRCFAADKSKSGFPKFKSKRIDTSGIRFPNFKIDNGRIHLSKMKDGIKIKLHRDLCGSPSMVTIYKDSIGDFYASIVVDAVFDERKVDTIKNSVGVDLGIKEFAVISDGRIIKNPRFGKREEKTIARIQRSVSRKSTGSNNRAKSCIKYAKMQKRIANKRKDFCNQNACLIAKNSDLIAIETLNIKGMMKNHRLSKSVASVAWGQFVASLRWQARKRGKYLVEINKWYPSSKRCSSCGNQKADLTLRDRIYICDACGFVVDRDLNAAINIHDEGTRIFNEINTVGTTEIHASGDMNHKVLVQPRKRRVIKAKRGSLSQVRK